MQNELENKSAWIVGVSLLLGLSVAGVSIGAGFYKSRTTDRYVTVKGLAEREVEADLAVWPITFKVSGNELGEITREIESNRGAIQQFLTEKGFDVSNISHAAPQITDTKTEVSYGQQNRSPYRYIAQSTVTLRTTEVGKVKGAMERADELIGRGVVIAQQSWQNSTEFLYVSLNEIKPAMIEEATRNARQAAQKFAEDSGSKIGKIRKATQGFFSINDRDRNSPDFKKIRVVTTVEYFLVDS